MQRPVEEVRHGVVALDRLSACGVDGNLDFVTDIGGVGGIKQVEPGVAGLLGVRNPPKLSTPGDLGCVSDLAAHLSIAGSAVENHCGAVFDCQHLENAGRVCEEVVARENRGLGGFDFRKGDDLFLLGRTGARALGFHEGVESLGVHREAAFARHELGEVEREALLVIEFECEGAGDVSLCCGIIEKLYAPVEGFVEGFLFDFQDIFDVFLFRADFGEDIAHRAGEDIDELVEEWRAETERAAVADGAAQDAAEHIVPVGVAGLNAVADGKGERADVVGNDAEGDIVFFLFGVASGTADGQRGSVGLAAEFFQFVEDRAEDVGLVVRDAGVGEIGEIFCALND